MKEEKTKKKKIIYYVLLLVLVCLLTAATVLTVYFVSDSGSQSIGGTSQDQVPAQPDEPTGNPDKPTGGDVEKFTDPLVYSNVTVFNDIYTSKTTGFIYRHQGVDFAADEGTKVNAIAEGTVESISLNSKTGNVITVNHGNGLKGYYRFVEPLSGLKEGTKLSKGQNFATVAAAYGSEAKDGTHLHFELKLNGKQVDPASYLDIQYEEK